MEKVTDQAFMDWYTPIHDRFIRYCSSQAHGLLAAEDLAQEAVLATLEAFDRVRDKNKLLSFMIGVVNNLVRNARRRYKFRAEWDEQALQHLESRAPSPEVALDIHYLLKALRELPAEQGEAILLFEVSGFKVDEIAGIQNASPAAVKTRLSRGRRRLRTLLEEDGARLTVAQRLSIYATILL